jgi:hypothetical protein
VLKRALRVVLAFGLLVAGYLGYGRAFAFVVSHVGRPTGVPIIPYDPSPSRTAREMIDLARSAFGPGHWTTDPTQAITYYDTERGYWLFFQRWSRAQEGKRLEFAPFAAIWRSRDKTNLNTMLGNKAYVDFDRPFEPASTGGGAAKVMHAMIEGEVRLRDDKGTRENPGDDLTIGPLMSLNYDAVKGQIATGSDVELRQADLVVLCQGLTIDLWEGTAPAGAPNAAAGPAPPGFAGARTIVLHNKIRIASENVGKIGVVPGGREQAQGARPGELTADGPARIDLPRPRGRPRSTPSGTPDPEPEPVIARFERNVVIRQGPSLAPVAGPGTPRPDQLNADVLVLTLVAKPAAPTATPEAKAVAASPPSVSSGSSPSPNDALSGLTLKMAEATGHAVWLQSPAQGLEARGNQLVFEKREPVEPDRIYFWGDKETRVVKTNLVPGDGPDAGKVSSIDAIRTIDVTIFQPRKPGEDATVVARGPGTLETRPGPGKTIERSASWADQLVYQTVATSAGERRRVTLTGSPTVNAPAQGAIVAKDRIVAYLKSKASAPKTTTPTAAPSSSPFSTGAGDAMEIDWVEAVGDVELTTANPAGAEDTTRRQAVKVRKRLDVVFASDETKQAASPAPATVAAAPRVAVAAPPAVPVVGAAPVEAAAKPKPKPSDSIEINAETAWARVLLGAKGAAPDASRGPSASAGLLSGSNGGASRVQEVRLRGDVHIHQGPAEGKSRGTDVTGQAVDLIARDEGQLWVEAHGDDRAPARVESDTMLLEGPKIGLDQSADFAWVKGGGRMKQDGPPAPPPSRTDQAVAPEVRKTSYQAPATEPANALAKSDVKAGPSTPFAAAKGPVSITWTQEMQFFGRPNDAASQGHAYALFLGDVKAITPDASLACGQMKAYLDGPVAFQKPEPRDPNDRDPSSVNSKPKPKIVLMHAIQNVLLTHRKVNPVTGRLDQKGIVTGPRLSYDLDRGDFLVEGSGQVKLYQPKGAKSPLGGARPAAPAPTDRTAQGTDPRVIPTSAGVPKSGKSGANVPLELTRVTFQKRVRGRVGNGDGATSTTDMAAARFLALFQGGVQVMHADVAGEAADLDPDDPPASYVLVVWEDLMVVRVAPRGADSQAQFFLDATGNPQAIAPPRSIRGDRITYDSMKDLVYVYGSEGGVTIVDQDGAGQPFSATRGQAVMFNRKSGQVQMIDPRNALIVDPRSGIRAVPETPPAPPAPPARPPRMIRNFPQNDKERRSFNGR